MLSWRNFDTSSDLLLMKLTGDVKIWYFSVKQKLHLLDPFWYVLAWSITNQRMTGFFNGFSFHFLEMLRYFCGVSLTFELQGIAVLIKSVFKCIFCWNLTYQQYFAPSKKVRQRKIIWFNPPYNVNVETSIGKSFLKLIDKYFPKTNKFHKIFNRSNVKVRYSCLPYFANIIKSYNNRILSEEKTKDQHNVIAERKILVL